MLPVIPAFFKVTSDEENQNNHDQDKEGRHPVYKQKDLTSLLSFPPLRFPPCCCVHVPISDQVTGSEFSEIADRLVE